jgi:hypothetical protein
MRIAAANKALGLAVLDEKGFERRVHFHLSIGACGISGELEFFGIEDRAGRRVVGRTSAGALVVVILGGEFAQRLPQSRK